MDDDEDYAPELKAQDVKSELSKPESKEEADLVNRNAEYQIRPSLVDKFKTLSVKEIIHTVLNEELGGKNYSMVDSERWIKNIVSNVKDFVKELGFKRISFGHVGLILPESEKQAKTREGTNIKKPNDTFGVHCRKIIPQKSRKSNGADEKKNRVCGGCSRDSMDKFFIDKLGNDVDDNCTVENKNTDENEKVEEDEFLSVQEIDLLDEPLYTFKSKETQSKKKDAFDIENTYLISNYKNFNKEENLYSNVDKILEKSVIKPGLEKQHFVPPEKSKKVLRLERKKLSRKTKGKQWFDMPATRVTKEIRTDFELLKMRSVLDKNHVYKKNVITSVPKYFQVGRVIESSADFYNGRIPKSQRKKTIVDELLADAEFKRYQKKKFKEIMDDNRRKNRTKKNMQNTKIGKKKNKQKS